ncbi:MAG: thioredoxin fold domain-containing protein [Gammaproteobacteria bacterium]|nr:thioredoxin fold domain-containing protein [Gammaproteobacteria bacterium]
MYKSLLLIIVLISNNVYANIETVLERLSPFFPSLTTEHINRSQLDGFYEVLVQTPQFEILYISNDGRYIIQGEVTDLNTRSSLSMSRLTAIKKQVLDSIDEDDKIVFKAENEQYVIHVFTDVDCPYCVKLHANMAEMNKLGITVKYLAAPLAQLHPQAQSKMEKIWCAENRNLAIHNYKTNRILPKSKRCDNPVAEQLAISQHLGVNGTPSIFFENGTDLPGYQDPQTLLQTIKQKLAQ